MGEPCKYEKEIGALIEASNNFKDFMKDMKDNHLSSIYDKLGVANRREAGDRARELRII